jgi:RNase H-fold protein (predicted Holliday junction resolvase)
MDSYRYSWARLKKIPFSESVNAIRNLIRRVLRTKRTSTKIDDDAAHLILSIWLLG